MLTGWTPLRIMWHWPLTLTVYEVLITTMGKMDRTMTLYVKWLGVGGDGKKWEGCLSPLLNKEQQMRWETKERTKISWSDLWKMEASRISFIMIYRYICDMLTSQKSFHQWFREDPTCALCPTPATLQHIMVWQVVRPLSWRPLHLAAQAPWVDSGEEAYEDKERLCRVGSRSKTAWLKYLSLSGWQALWQNTRSVSVVGVLQGFNNNQHNRKTERGWFWKK